MQEWKDENLNTINLRSNSDLVPIIIDENGKNNLIRFKLSLQKNNKINPLESKEFENIIKEIIQTKNTDFIDGKINLIEYLIQKTSSKDMENKNFRNVNQIQLKLYDNFPLLNEFGRYMPNITNLNLSGSLIKSIEDIGSTYVNLRHLNVSNCQLEDLTGIFY
jgi:hypothetical protein